MANAPTVGIRLDEVLLAAYSKVMKERGSNVSRGFEQHMSEVTGLPVTRRPVGINANNELPRRRLDYKCKFCGAEPGDKCRDMRKGGNATVARPHPERGL